LVHEVVFVGVEMDHLESIVDVVSHVVVLVLVGYPKGLQHHSVSE
jgi:hypothetical protein